MEIIKQNTMISTVQPLGDRLFPNGEWILLIVLLFELVVFGLTGANFLTSENAFEITRLSVEVGSTEVGFYQGEVARCLTRPSGLRYR